MTGAPLWISCEGSGLRPARHDICAMCGRHVYLTTRGLTYKHKRKDVLAMIERGDYDPRS